MPPPPPDTSGLGFAAGRLGGAARKAGRPAILVAGALLEEGETVSNLVAGVIEGRNGVAVLTDRRLLFVNEGEWKPKVLSVPLADDLAVQGWQDGRHASMSFQGAPEPVMVERIADLGLAQELAGNLRARVAQLSGS